MRISYKELFQPPQDADGVSGYYVKKLKDESVQRFLSHTRMCKENLKNWRLDK